MIDSPEMAVMVKVSKKPVLWEWQRDKGDTREIRGMDFHHLEIVPQSPTSDQIKSQSTFCISRHLSYADPFVSHHTREILLTLPRRSQDYEESPKFLPSACVLHAQSNAEFSVSPRRHY